MTRLQHIPDARGATRSTYRIANQHAAKVNPIQKFAPTTAPKALVPGPLLLKNRSANQLHRAVGAMAGTSNHAFPIQNMRHPYPRSTPSHQRPTLTGRRRTNITCLSRKGLLRPGNTILASTITRHRA
jgi:hypothetical protein